MANETLELLRRLRDDLPLFGEQCLKIRTKEATIRPLKFNAAQLRVHELLEQQKREKGYVRALILKARQQGFSTYVAARFYHQASLQPGKSVYILSHEQSSADTLFGIVDRYQRNNAVAPIVGTSNVKELIFSKLDSSYSVATAGQKAGGRGKAISLFHGSEVPLWPNAEDHFSASVQGVPLLPGTEVILEGTGNGPGGAFHSRWQKAVAGIGDYIAIFVPFSETPEYARTPDAGFELDAEASEGEMSEVEIVSQFGLSHAQMAWRRSKIAEQDSLLRFHREYPLIEDEAWLPEDMSAMFIPPLSITRARKNKTIEGLGPLIFGVDPASNGGDRFAVAARRGAQILWVKHRNKLDPLEGVAWIKGLIDEHDPARVNIDAGHIGVAIISGVKSYGPKYVDKVRTVNFGGTSQAKLASPRTPGPANRRAEMWGRMKAWLADEGGARIPDMAALADDMMGPRLEPRANNDYLLESKPKMRARGIASPDLADAVALTFASNEYIDKYSAAKAQTSFGHLDTPKANQPKAVRDDNSSAYSWMA